MINPIYNRYPKVNKFPYFPFELKCTDYTDKYFDCIITYAYENAHIFPRSFFIFLLSFFSFHYNRSKGVMIAQQSFGRNCQPVQNWLQGQVKQNRANRWPLNWKSFETVDFLIFLYGREKLTSKEFARHFCFLFVLFCIFPSGLLLSMRLVLWRIPSLLDVHTHIHTLFTGSHYDTWRRIMRLSYVKIPPNR